jgi:hypothetical protein
MEITAIIVICRTALDGGSKVFTAIRVLRLTEREKELLVHAERDGDFHYLHTNVYGDWVRAGTQDFFDRGDRAHQAYYIDAFRSLYQRGFVRHAGGHLFRLTGAGLDQARELAKERGAASDEWAVEGVGASMNRPPEFCSPKVHALRHDVSVRGSGATSQPTRAPLNALRPARRRCF